MVRYDSFSRGQDPNAPASPTKHGAANRKQTNPKDIVGVRKSPMSAVPALVLAEVGNAMLEGARKYGRYNYRKAGVVGSVYYDAAHRHLARWWDMGEDTDPDSGLSHITKAIASLVVLRDGMLMRNWIDDRPPAIQDEEWQRIQKQAAQIVDRYPDAVAPVTAKSLAPETPGGNAALEELKRLAGGVKRAGTAEDRQTHTTGSKHFGV